MSEEKKSLCESDSDISIVDQILVGFLWFVVAFLTYIFLFRLYLIHNSSANGDLRVSSTVTVALRAWQFVLIGICCL